MTKSRFNAVQKIYWQKKIAKEESTKIEYYPFFTRTLALSMCPEEQFYCNFEYPFANEL